MHGQNLKIRHVKWIRPRFDHALPNNALVIYRSRSKCEIPSEPLVYAKVLKAFHVQDIRMTVAEIGEKVQGVGCRFKYAVMMLWSAIKYN